MSRKEKFFWWKVIITVMSFVAVILSKSTIYWSNLSNNYIDLAICKEITYDLSVGIFSAMILVWFIDEINEHIQEKKNKAKEFDEIIRSNRLLQLYIERYKVFFYCVITPMKQRDFKNIKFPTDFKLKDMRELHKQTLLVGEGTFDSSIESFLDAESELKSEIESIIRSINFNYFPATREYLIQFVEGSLKYNQKNAILEAKNITMGDKRKDVVIEYYLENYADDFYQDIQLGKNHGGNIMHPYIYLYEMLKIQYNAIIKYEQELQKMQ